MTRTRDNHRPLVSGLRIMSKTGTINTLHVGSGTLTGLATRNSDGKKMLVTNLHVMAGDDDNGDFRNPSGNEEMYQGLSNPSDKVGSHLCWEPISFTGNNYVDVAMCELDEFNETVTAEFALHDSPHSDRKIIAGVVESTVNMELTLLGEGTGEKTATVTRINREGNFGGVEFAGLMELRSSSPLVDGDSGSPCLYRVQEGVYKMVGIVFAVNLLNNQVVWAFPASSAERELGITFGKRPPVASATTSLATAAPGVTVILNGSGSSDSDGEVLTYRWEQVPGVGGGSVALTNADAAITTFTAPSSPAALTFRLTVTDSAGSTATDTVSVNVSSAEALGTLGVGSAKTDSGTWSSDIPSLNRERCYARYFTFKLDQRQNVQIDLTSSEDTFLYLLSGRGELGPVLDFNDDIVTGNLNSQIVKKLDAGEYTIEATTYAEGATGSFELSVSSQANRAPTAIAGADRTVSTGENVTLFGSGTDPDGDLLTYLWTQLSGTSVGLTNATISRPRFTAPSSAATLVFRLTVSDPDGQSGTDDVTITVSSQTNRDPRADAGRSLSVDTGDRVTLDGSDSSDPDGDSLKYSWSQIRGETVSLSSTRVARPTFTAPSSAGSLRFRLTVTDEHGASDSDDVVIAVRATNHAPEADAGRNQTVQDGDTVTLDGSGSSDPDGDSLTYSWSQATGVTLSSTSVARPTFTAQGNPERIYLTFRLTVTDPDGLTDSDNVTITVLGSESD